MFEIMAEFVPPTGALQAPQPALSIFGSARAARDSSALRASVAQSRGNAPTPVCPSGGGPGIGEGSEPRRLLRQGPQHRARYPVAF